MRHDEIGGARPLGAPRLRNGNYLSRPLIEGVSYEISDTDIAIQSPHTCYVRCKLPRRRDKDALLRQYSGVLAVAKAQRVKISYTLHIRKTIQEQIGRASCRERVFGLV